jgi:ABC-type transport system involved in cytochrome bd biosynthesis fused ATPase/permease subunit
VSEQGPDGSGGQRSRSSRPIVAAVVWAAASVAAFAVLDPVIAAFGSIIGATIVVIAFLASDWGTSSTFEEREAERARKRKVKWEAGTEARDRDRARWEAHRARQARKTGR